MMSRRGIVTVLVASFVASAANAQTADEGPPRPRSFVCPTDGKEFEQSVDYPHLPLVQFPDASHLGDEYIDAQIPECPASKILILPDFSAEPPAGQAIAYHNYSADERKRLDALLGEAEWKALAGASRYQRAYWLASRLQRPAKDRLELLVRGPWAATTDPALHRLALEQLVRDVPALINEAKLKPQDAAAATILRVNALRELGQFTEARAALDVLERDGMKAFGPDDPDALFPPGDYIGKMRAVIDGGDDDRFAVDLLTDSFARRVCGGGDYSAYRGKHAKDACAARAKRKAALDTMLERANALEADLPALEKSCAALPASNTDEALAYACRSLVFKRDWAQGQKLADADPVALAAMCESTDERRRNTIEISACSSYEIYRNEVALALVTKLDEPSYTKLCKESESKEFGSSCDRAYGERVNIAARELLRDPAALKTRCAEKADTKDLSLEMACEALIAKTPPYWFGEELPVVGNGPISHAALPYVESALQKALKGPAR